MKTVAIVFVTVVLGAILSRLPAQATDWNVMNLKIDLLVFRV